MVSAMFCHAGPGSLVLFFSSRIVIYRSKCRRMDCNYGEVHCDSVKIADRSDSLRVHHKHVPWKIILVSYTRPLFRSTKANYFIGQLWQLLTASNVGALTQAWQAKRAVFKIPGFVCKRFLPFFPAPPRSFTCAILVPRSLFLHRTETLATQATSSQVLLQIRIEHKEYICHRCIADWAKTLLSL